MDGNSSAQRHEGQLSGSPSSLGFDTQRSSSSATRANSISLLQTRGLWPPEAQSSFFDDHSAPFLGMRPPNFSSNPTRFRPLSFPAYNNIQSRNPAERSGIDIVPGGNIGNRQSPSSISNRPWEAVARSSVDSLASSSTSIQNPRARFERRIFLTPLTGQADLSSSDASSAALPLPQVPGGVEESNSPARGTSTTPTSVTHLPISQPSSIPNGLDHSASQNDIGLEHTAPFSGEAERAAAERMIYNDNDDGMLTENRIDHFISRRNVQVNGASASRMQDPASAGNVATRIATRERLRRMPRGYGGPVKLVASTSFLESLEQPAVESLDLNDRTCVICYNEYGISNPEGIIETPRRLPKCKHIFGNKCLKKWLKSADSCPYCRDKLPSAMKTVHRHANRIPDEIAARRSPIQYTGTYGGMLSDDDMDYGSTDADDGLSAYVPRQLRARALAMARGPVQTTRNDDTRSVGEEGSQPLSFGSYSASGAAPHEFSRQSFMDFIQGYPPAHQDSPSFNLSSNTRSPGRTLPALHPESMSSPYSPQFDYADFHRRDSGSFNRQQIAPSPGIPPTRRSVPAASSTQRMQSELSYMTYSLPQSSDSFRGPWSPTQSAPTQTRQIFPSQEVNNAGSGSGPQLEHHDYRNPRQSNSDSVTEGQQSNTATYVPSDQNTSPPYLRGGFQAGFVRSPVHHSSPFQYSTTNNTWEVAR